MKSSWYKLFSTTRPNCKEEGYKPPPQVFLKGTQQRILPRHTHSTFIVRAHRSKIGDVPHNDFETTKQLVFSDIILGEGAHRGQLKLLSAEIQGNITSGLKIPGGTYS